MGELAFFISIMDGQIMDSNGTIVKNDTGSLPTEIIGDICKIDGILYEITASDKNYELQKIKFSNCDNCDNYVVSEFTINYVKINDIIYKLSRKSFYEILYCGVISNIDPTRIDDVISNIDPISIHNIDEVIIEVCINKKYVHTRIYVFVDNYKNLIVCDDKNNCTILEKNIDCNKLFIIDRFAGYGYDIEPLTILLFYDDKIVQLYYDTYETNGMLFRLINKIVTQISFIIKEIYYRHTTEIILISDDNNVYNVKINVYIDTDNVVITPLHFDNNRVTDIIFMGWGNYVYLSTEKLLYDDKDKLLLTNIVTQKISGANNTKSANFICKPLH